MANKILICGINGAGKSTLGKQLASKIGYKFADIEDYYFTDTDTEYKYSSARTKQEAVYLMLNDMKTYDNMVIAAVKCDYGCDIISMLTHIIYICVPPNISLERVKNRSYKRYGSRVLPGGDLYEREKKFFDLVEQRSEQYVEKWLDSVNIPITRIDGTKSVEENIDYIIKILHILSPTA